MSHFSCIFPQEPDIKLYEKIPKILITINGLHFTNDGILVMQRIKNGAMLNVFLFSNSMGQQGVENDFKPRLLNQIYKMTSEKVKNLLQLKFAEAKKNLRKYMTEDDLWEAGVKQTFSS